MDRLKPDNSANARLLFMDDDCECDICDEKGLCAHIDSIASIHVAIICKSCLKEMIKQMEDAEGER